MTRSGESPFWRTYDRLAERVDARVGWDKLPAPLGLLVLIGLRNLLRRHNLYDTSGGVRVPAPPRRPQGSSPLTGRTADGTWNNLEHPANGAAGTRFGRNVPLADAFPEPDAGLLSPNPRLVSRRLMTRRQFIPATSLNLLAAAWVQFMVKDWFSHGRGDPAQRWDLTPEPGDPWPAPPLRILKTPPDPARTPGDGRPPAYLNTETHWWDGSQLYGGSTLPEGKLRRRSGRDGKLLIGADGLLHFPDEPGLSPAQVPGWWLGLDMMSTLFVREHNAICDALKGEYPHWPDEELYQRARLVNSALLARIHTVEWTPAILSHPTAVVALHANWWGIAGERVRTLFGRLSTSEVVSGIPGSAHDDYGVPYSLTEEFTIVYRMHPLVPDDYVLRACSDDRTLLTTDLRGISGPRSQDVTATVPMADLLYSFGTSHPGAIVLDNFPRYLQEFERPDGVVTDLASTDILRTRELGVPRYNAFRRLLRLPPARSFDDLTDDRDLAARIAEVYDGDIERVDTIVGMFAEKRPRGFAFSETAFRIFILMASRRLNSDRFLTDDFTAEVYTPLGLRWVQDNSMVDVLLRHHPELRAALRGAGNAFAPWSRPPRG